LKKCVHIGDLLETDAFGAYAAGFKWGVWINREGRAAVISPFPDGVREIHQLSEILPFLFTPLIDQSRP